MVKTARVLLFISAIETVVLELSQMPNSYTLGKRSFVTDTYPGPDGVPEGLSYSMEKMLRFTGQRAPPSGA